MKYKLLVLTDHSSQNDSNSIFALLQAMRIHPHCEQIDVASKGVDLNRRFFKGELGARLYACEVTADFSFQEDGRYFTQNLRAVALEDYDALFLRLPPPLDNAFLTALSRQFPDRKIINRPSGLIKTASKAYLLQFPEVCPPMKLCETAADIRSFSEQFPVVLKPLRNYGGRGIVKIENEQAEQDGEVRPLSQFLENYRQDPVPYLAMKFLVNVDQGDKRIVVVNGRILGGVLRMPPPGAWLCNAAQGGYAVSAAISPEEYRIAEVITPVLLEAGIVMFGFDTLTDDAGRRVLSEINTLSIGGLPQMGELNNTPVVDRAAGLLWQYVNKEMYGQQD
jgi:glutathione synthase